MSTDLAAKYSKPITRADRGCILFLVDHSLSMVDPIAASPRSKIQAVEAALNRLFGELIMICEGETFKDRFDLGIISYTTDRGGTPVVGPAFGGALKGKELVSISEIYQNPLETQQRERKVKGPDGTLVSQTTPFPVWYKPPDEQSMAGTPMCAAFDYIRRIIESWCAAHPNSFPPIVIHLTDGESTDGNPEPNARALRELGTDDGEVLLFNCHLSEVDAAPVMFPSSTAELPNDEYAHLLFDISSELPAKLLDYARSKELQVTDGARGMVFNADSAKMLMLINVGTVVAGLR